MHIIEEKTCVKFIDVPPKVVPRSGYVLVVKEIDSNCDGTSGFDANDKMLRIDPLLCSEHLHLTVKGLFNILGIPTNEIQDIDFTEEGFDILNEVYKCRGSKKRTS